MLRSHQYHFATNTYFSMSSIYPSKGVHWCSRKRQFELSEPPVHWCFEKITAPKISAYFAYFPVKHAGWSSFKVHSQAFLGFFSKSSLEQLYCRKPVITCFCKKELQSTSYLRNFPEF